MRQKEEKIMNVKKRAAREARKLLDQFNIDSPRVDVEAVASALGINVAYEYLDDDVSGMLVISNHSVTIVVNANDGELRQRFTLAHELGHYKLRRNVNTNVFVDKTLTFHRDKHSSEGTYLDEIAANAFAAELLMPSRFLEEYIYEDWYDDDVVKDIANLFGVSVPAMTFRIANLGYVDSE
jgi:Zn-dependent peptidase ImmA (M78 family)